VTDGHWPGPGWPYVRDIVLDVIETAGLPMPEVGLSAAHNQSVTRTHGSTSTRQGATVSAKHCLARSLSAISLERAASCMASSRAK
jgi:hypothetical protein